MEYEGSIILKIKEWLFEYAARFGMTKVLQEIADKHSDLWAMEKCQVNHILPLLVIFKNMVYFQEVKEYPVAIELMDKLYMQRQHIFSISKYVKLQLSLKTMVMFDMLKNDHPDIIRTFNAYFPRSGFVAPKISSGIAEKLKPVLKDFRKLFSDLISRPTYRKDYLREDYENDYGEEFQTKMKRYVDEFVGSIRKDMPPTVIERILKNPSEIYRFAKQSSSMIGVLMDNLENLEVLDEAKVLRILELFRLLSEEYDMHSLSTSDNVMDAYSASILLQIENGRPDVTDDNNDNRMVFAEKKSKIEGDKANLSMIEECSDSGSDYCAVEASNDDINPSSSNTISKVAERKNSKKRKRTRSDSPDASVSSSAKKPCIIQEISLCDSDSSTSTDENKGLNCSGKEFAVGMNNLFQRGKTKGTSKTPKKVLKRKMSEERPLNLSSTKHGREGLEEAVVVLKRLSEADIAKSVKRNGVEENKNSEKLLASFKDCEELDLHLKAIRRRFSRAGTKKRGPKMTNLKRSLVGLAYMSGSQTDKQPAEGVRVQILGGAETEEGRPKLKVVDRDEYRRAMSVCSQSSSDCQSSILSVASEPAYESTGFELVDDEDMFSYLQGIHESNEEGRLKCSQQTKNDRTISRKKKKETKNSSLLESEVVVESFGPATKIAEEVADKDDVQNIQAVVTKVDDDVTPDVANDSPMTDVNVNPQDGELGLGETEISDVAETVHKDGTILDLLMSNNSEKADGTGFTLLDDGDMFSYLQGIHESNEEGRLKCSPQSKNDQTISGKKKETGNASLLESEVVGESFNNSEKTDDDQPKVERPVEELHDKTPENRAEDVDQSEELARQSSLLIDFIEDLVAEQIDESGNVCELQSAADETTDKIGKDCIPDTISQPAVTQFYSPPSTGTLLHVAQSNISSAVARHLSLNSSDSFHSCQGPSQSAVEKDKDFHLSDLLTDDEHDLFGDMLDDAPAEAENFYDKLVESNPGKDSNVSICGSIKEFDIKLYKTDIFIETEEGHKFTIYK